MDLDTDQTFYDICPDPDSFRRQLQEISQFRTPSSEFEEWPRNLRFITSHPASRRMESGQQRAEKTKFHPNNERVIIEEQPSHVEEEKLKVAARSTSPCACNAWSRQAINHDDCRLWITDKPDAPDCTHFVAVSYCWPQPDDDAPVSHPHFTLCSNNGQKENDAPNDVIERAIRFANAHNLSAVWIDQECINQADQEDKESGIHSMDRVYHLAEASVALLSVVIEEQETLDFFNSQMLRVGSFDSTTNLNRMLSFLRWIDSERWFTRAWCMQESWSAGSRMQLMVRHKTGLDKPASLGDIDGEVLVNYAVFCVNLKWMLSRLERSQASLPELQVNGDWLEGLRRRMIKIHEDMNDVFGIVGSPQRLRCSAAEGLDALADRQNSRVVDRLAILANLCEYTYRLNTDKLEKGGYSFSICAIALAMLNGDISLISVLPHNAPATPVAISGSNGVVSIGVDIVERLGYSWGPPLHTRLNKLDWIPENVNPTRLVKNDLTTDGLSTCGWLFECDLIIDVAPVQRHYSAAWASLHPPSPSRSPEEISAAQTKLNILIVWNTVRYLMHKHYFHLAQLIWESENDFCLLPASPFPPLTSSSPVSTSVETPNLLPVPTNISHLLDLATLTFIFSPPLTESSFLDRLVPRNPHPASPSSASTISSRDWLPTLVMTSARIPCGRQISSGPKPRLQPRGLAFSTVEGKLDVRPNTGPNFPWEVPEPGEGGGPPPLPFAEELVPGTVWRKAEYRAVYESEEGFRKAVFTPTMSEGGLAALGRYWAPRHWVARRVFRREIGEGEEEWRVEGGGMTRGFVGQRGVWAGVLLF